MSKLRSDYEVPILKALSDDGGYLTGQIASCFPSPFNRTKREHSSDVRAWLDDMAKRDLVRRLLGQKPACWVRTAFGRAALAEAQKEMGK